jgi:hypothetical protein
MKRELAHRRRWATRADARRDLIRWIEGSPHNPPVRQMRGTSADADRDHGLAAKIACCRSA